MATWNMLQPGDAFGDLRVLKELGRGGMGAVYLAMDEASGQKFAVKVLFPEAEARDHDSAVGRFIREAEIAMTIEHPNLVKVFDVGRDPETGLGFILMEYVYGGSLFERLMHRLANREGPFKIKEAISIVRQIASALIAAEEHGVVHRDIKLENILFDGEGRPRLADLGVAKRTGVSVTMTLTMTDMVIGTPAYMSPEQLSDSKHVDIRADIYSLGIVLWQLLAGELPYEDTSMAALLTRAVRKERIPDIRSKRPKVSRKISMLIKKMTAPQPERRFQHPAEIIEFLDKYSARERRMFRLMAAGGVAAVLLSAAVTWVVLDRFVYADDGETENEAQAEENFVAAKTAVIEPAAEPAAESVAEPAAESAAEPAVVKSAVTEAAPPSAPAAVEAKPEVKPTAAIEPEEKDQVPEVEELLKEFREILDAPNAASRILKAVNEARKIDPDFTHYDWDGNPKNGGILVADKDLAALRRGRVFLLGERYRRKKGLIIDLEKVRSELGLLQPEEKEEEE